MGDKMMRPDGFRGHGREKNRTGVAIGPISQKRLLPMIRVLIDASRSKAASRTRDDARAALRLIGQTANWNTPYILRNLRARRCRYLYGLGWPVPTSYLVADDISRLVAWNEQHG
jgi:hypothetical protein